MTDLFMISLIPLVLFAIINYYTNLKISVVSSIASALLMLVFFWWVLDWFDPELIIMVVTLIVFGTVAIYKDDEFYFKLQPAVTGVGVVIFMIYFEVIGEPLLFKMLPKVGKLLPPDKAHLLENSQVLATMHTLSLHGIFWIFVHSVLLGWCARFSSTKVWLLVKAFFLPAFLLIMLLTMKVVVS